MDDFRAIQMMECRRTVTACYWEPGADEDDIFRDRVDFYLLGTVVESGDEEFSYSDVRPARLDRYGDLDIMNEVGNFLGLEFDGIETDWSEQIETKKKLELIRLNRAKK